MPSEQNEFAVAVLTSGGDAQGMNSAIRSVALTAMCMKAKVFAVYWGYQGLVDGGDSIKELTWNDVSDIIHLGGTKIGSARCDSFRKPEGRKLAALNMIKSGIMNLIIIGGDGSLTGADLFRSEWDKHCSDLLTEGQITKQQREKFTHLNIVGLVGSIDNDFCGTDMTIGADSALHRIVECVDSIITTAESHQRAFVLEVMGRNSGYLALISSIAVSADYVFLPEQPEDEWQNKLCGILKKNRDSGKLFNIIIVAEGAVDKLGKTITSGEVKNCIQNTLKYDPRITVLGHVQRGGSPSAFDRVLALRFGMEATRLVLNAKPSDPTYVLCLRNNEIVKSLLSECIKDCNAIKEAYKKNDFATLSNLRGPSFIRNMELLNLIKRATPPQDINDLKRMNIGIVHVGAPASGMNMCVMTFTRSLIKQGYSVIGINDGFTGLLKNQHVELNWKTVDSWYGQGGCNLGTSRTTPSYDFAAVAKRLEELKLSGLLVIGGFEAYLTVVEMSQHRATFPAFNLPVFMIPATIGNNVPGTDISIGADTSLNVIASSCDMLRLSANSSRDRVFVVETMGGKCGYLTSMGAIASGADIYYTFHHNLDIDKIIRDATFIRNEFISGSIKCGIVIKSESYSKNVTTDFVTKVYDEIGKGVFRACSTVLGHVQQGGVPSPFDRVLGAKFGAKAAELFDKFLSSNGKSDVPQFSVIGLTCNGFDYISVEKLKDKTDFSNRFPTVRWWEPHIRSSPCLKSVRRCCSPCH